MTVCFFAFVSLVLRKHSAITLKLNIVEFEFPFRYVNVLIIKRNVAAAEFVYLWSSPRCLSVCIFFFFALILFSALVVQKMGKIMHEYLYSYISQCVCWCVGGHLRLLTNNGVCILILGKSRSL